MLKKKAPVSLTAGKGFSFEDCVAAWFMAHLLSGRLPLGTEFGKVIRIDFQIRDSGWLLDDLLITSQFREKLPKCLALSIKRHRQVTRNGFPDNFVETVWEQWLGTQSDTFVKDRDILGLATGQLAESVKSAWDALLSQSLATSSERLANRLSTRNQSSKIQRAIFDSLQCPNRLKRDSETDKIATAYLLQHIRLIPFDFDSSNSLHEATAIEICQSCLESSSSDEAIALWFELIAISATFRTEGGSINLPLLLRQLYKYRLKDYPDTKSDWAKLKGITEDATSWINTKIGNNIEIPRKDLIKSIQEGLKKYHIQILVGESGSGKSAIGKLLAHSGIYKKVVWLNDQHLNAAGLSSVSRTLGLGHDIRTLFSTSGSMHSLLVFDAIEKFSQDSINNTIQIINSLKLQTEGVRWKILITTQPLSWSKIEPQLQLSRLELSANIVQILDFPHWDELTPVTKQHPTLNSLSLRPEFRGFLRNLKILDLIVKGTIKKKLDATDFVGLSDMIDWMWDSWIQSGSDRYARSGLLKKIGFEETKSFFSGLPLTDLSQTELQALSALEEEHIIRIINERVYFTHDLLGDWSRLRYIIGLNESEIPNQIRKLTQNPRWHNAVRLFGLRVLEKSSDDSKFYSLFKSLNDGSDFGAIASDLILESVSTGIETLPLLERVWVRLAAHNGRLLQRLLKRFRHAASFPDPRVSEIPTDDDIRILLSSSMRIPYWPYWAPMIKFLHIHAHDVKKLASIPTAEICKLWLSQMPVVMKSGNSFPWRKEAAELAVIIAREIQGQKAEGVIIANQEIEKTVYEALLYAAPDLPDEVSSIALELSKRRPPSEEIQKRAYEAAKRRQEEHEKRLHEDSDYRERQTSLSQMVSLSSFEGRLLDPWPDGPSERVNSAFRKVCMEKGALSLLMQYKPEVAKEIILALCIESPRHEYDDYDILDYMRYGTSHDMYQPMFFKGPFLQFLNIEPKAGIETIISLVNHATERWRDFLVARNGLGAESDINENLTINLWIGDTRKQWLGDCRVFGWYRKPLQGSPSIVSSLMAVEKWLYTEIESGKDVSKWIEIIFNLSKSTVFAGVLVAVGKKHPELFKSCLTPVLSAWQIFHWDMAIQRDDYSTMALTLWVNHGEEVFNMVRDWHIMPHRKVLLRDVIIQLILNDKEFREHSVTFREKWKSYLDIHGNKTKVKFLIEQLNPDNYKFGKDEAGNIIALLELPEHLQKISEKTQESSSYAITLLDFPYRCRELINKNKPLDAEQIERLWNTIDFLKSKFDDQKHDPTDLYNALMAGFAVLFYYHLDWLDDNQDKKDQCLEEIRRIVSSKHERDRLDSPYSISDTTWETFLGEIAICLLADNPIDRDIRELVVNSALAYHYVTTAALCKAAYQFREKLASTFYQILNLCRIWAGIQWALHKCHRFAVKVQDLDTWYQSVSESFINGEMTSETISWKEIAEKTQQIVWKAEIKYIKEKGYEFYPKKLSEVIEEQTSGEDLPTRDKLCFDWHVIQATYSWLPVLKEAIDDNERAKWISIHRDLLELELKYLHTAKRKRGEKLEGTPYEFETWVIRLIGKLIPQLKRDEKPHEFWVPIMDLGAPAHYWVDDFFYTFIIEGSKSAESQKVFTSHWRQLIQYALDSPTWRNDNSIPCYYYLDDLYIQLMGFGFGSNIVGDQSFLESISELVPLFERWGNEWLSEASLASAFSSFLLKPAAQEMLLPGIIWLSDAVDKIWEYRWKTYPLSTALMSVLNTCWERYRNELEINNSLKAAFLKILGKLVSKQYPDALELKDQIVQSIR